ncbi:CPBP family intramembrane glutamic endopeptidase [Streptomyces benahoarensis]|uniref:CPBP family intramembrane metalloprotease n=1 Tax=Streptomyces benahoarensis TaxID=2595054 RepID=A0A553ZIN6_9ACTN|nr:CPBP family intramembrane glutamic endopeptidase [Streptomyces benahoarensis]TSB22233.1 CPBP family intramembrane metalloprotease [Streptomyces benahoarensis]TSB41309.1 CPBP family intramembrane metalloprotease [Streptomyces benahoarensis]
MWNDHVSPVPAAPPVAPPEHTGKRPGWPEIAVAAVAYVVLVVAGIALIVSIPDEHAVARGIVSYVVSALAGLGAFGMAFVVRLRDPGAFGLRRVSGKWLLVGAGLGLGAFVLNIAVSAVYARLSGDTGNPQGDYRAAAGGGAFAFVLTLLCGAVATPLGEELAFRGVLAGALGRYGSWASVLGSSAVFALAHGLNVILPIAFVVGTASSLLLRKTGSVWPGVCVHAANNGLSVILPALAALAAR